MWGLSFSQLCLLGVLLKTSKTARAGACLNLLGEPLGERVYHRQVSAHWPPLVPPIWRDVKAHDTYHRMQDCLHSRVGSFRGNSLRRQHGLAQSRCLEGQQGRCRQVQLCR